MIKVLVWDDDFMVIKWCQGGEFERRIVFDDFKQFQEIVCCVIWQIVNWLSIIQSIKGLLMGGF